MFTQTFKNNLSLDIIWLLIISVVNFPFLVSIYYFYFANEHANLTENSHLISSDSFYASDCVYFYLITALIAELYCIAINIASCFAKANSSIIAPIIISVISFSSSLWMRIVSMSFDSEYLNIILNQSYNLSLNESYNLSFWLICRFHSMLIFIIFAIYFFLLLTKENIVNMDHPM